VDAVVAIGLTPGVKKEKGFGSSLCGCVYSCWAVVSLLLAVVFVFSLVLALNHSRSGSSPVTQVVNPGRESPYMGKLPRHEESAMLNVPCASFSRNKMPHMDQGLSSHPYASFRWQANRCLEQDLGKISTLIPARNNCCSISRSRDAMR
jgi:hypothetical protein